ncbi:MAG: hypothetical protein BRD55_07710 [Bacteroidetes bacterium SW_9_63_38]|nr:MAG: hypothetical protein BRD55_07710 [Bacteroidetes bacterium SW_9_63_38]
MRDIQRPGRIRERLAETLDARLPMTRTELPGQHGRVEAWRQERCALPLSDTHHAIAGGWSGGGNLKMGVMYRKKVTMLPRFPGRPARMNGSVVLLWTLFSTSSRYAWT